MQEIKQHFDFPDEYDKCVLKQLNAAWKDEKGDLKRKYFKPFTSTSERLANCPEKFPEDQWMLLVEHWEKREVAIEADPEREAPPGTPATRIEIFKKTHTRKDMTPISDLAKNKMDMMEEYTAKAIEEDLAIEPDSIFTQVMGDDSRGRRRCFGRATFPGDSSTTSSTRESADVTTLKRKLVDVEEELKTSREKYSALENTTNCLQTSLNTTIDALEEMRACMRIVLGDKFSIPAAQVGRTSSSSSPSSTTHPNNP